MIKRRKKKLTKKHEKRVIDGIAKLLEVADRPPCPNSNCANHKTKSTERIKKQGFIVSKDETKKTQRYKCMDCGEKFTDTRNKPRFRNEEVKKSIPKSLARNSNFDKAARELQIHPEILGYMTKDIATKADSKSLVRHFYDAPEEWLIIEVDVTQNLKFKARVLFYFFPNEPDIKKVEVNKLDLLEYDREQELVQSLEIFSLRKDTGQPSQVRIFSSHQYKKLPNISALPENIRWETISRTPELKIQKWTRAKTIDHLIDRMNIYMLTYNEYLKANP